MKYELFIMNDYMGLKLILLSYCYHFRRGKNGPLTISRNSMYVQGLLDRIYHSNGCKFICVTENSTINTVRGRVIYVEVVSSLFILTLLTIGANVSNEDSSKQNSISETYLDFGHLFIQSNLLL